MTKRGWGLTLAATLVATAAAAAPLETPSAPRLPEAVTAAAPAAPVPSAAEAQASAAADLGALAAAPATAALPASASPAPEAAGFEGSLRFDGAAVRRAAYSAVAAAEAAPAGPLAVPAAHALSRRALAPRPQPDGIPLGRRLGHLLESHVTVALPSTLLGAMLAGFFAHSSVLPLAMAGFSLVVTAGMEDYVAHQRRRVVGGWQASHDQRYRVDPATGRLRDVRGRKIGEDRYEMYAPGELTRGERLWMRLLGLGMGAAWLHAAGTGGWWLFSAAAAGGLLVSGLAAARRAAPFVPDADEKAHAARFNQD